jgi:hypothetical protein
MKSTVNEIRQRFDVDVERFSNLETGQSATVDAPLAMALVAQAARPRPVMPAMSSTLVAEPGITRSSCWSTFRNLISPWST